MGTAVWLQVSKMLQPIGFTRIDGRLTLTYKKNKSFYLFFVPFASKLGLKDYFDFDTEDGTIGQQLIHSKLTERIDFFGSELYDIEVAIFSKKIIMSIRGNNLDKVAEEIEKSGMFSAKWPRRLKKSA